MAPFGEIVRVSAMEREYFFQSITSWSENKLQEVWLWSWRATSKWHLWFITLLIRFVNNFRWFQLNPFITEFPIPVLFNGFNIHCSLLPRFMISFWITTQKFSDFSILCALISWNFIRKKVLSWTIWLIVKYSLYRKDRKNLDYISINFIVGDLATSKNDQWVSCFC